MPLQARVLWKISDIPVSITWLYSLETRSIRPGPRKTDCSTQRPSGTRANAKPDFPIPSIADFHHFIGLIFAICPAKFNRYLSVRHDPKRCWPPSCCSSLFVINVKSLHCGVVNTNRNNSCTPLLPDEKL